MDKLSLKSFYKRFPNEEACLAYLEEARWPKGRVCPHCGGLKSYKFKNGKLFKCAECKKQFTAKVGTIFTDSHIPLQDWFLAIYLLTTQKKGISSIRLAEYLEVTQKTAWFMLHRIRYAMEYGVDKPLSGTIEMDETYIAGKRRDRAKGGRNTENKSVVFGMVERHGSVKSFVTEDATRDSIEYLIRDNVARSSTVNTDYFRLYKSMITQIGMKHERINHSEGKYVIGSTHTNTIEGFWSHLKQGIGGIYIHVSPKHLQRYCTEYEYRYNTRDMTGGERFEYWFGRINRKQLPYKSLIDG